MPSPSENVTDPAAPASLIDSPEAEADRLYMLLAVSLAVRHWQHGAGSVGDAGLFGHNVAAVLADRDGLPFGWARNASKSMRNLTEHAEVRLVRGAIAAQEGTDLYKCTIYTTLEPCVMCAGMMTMANVRRVIFGLRDSSYGGVFERLDSYPLQPEVNGSTLALVSQMENSYRQSSYETPAVWLLRSEEALQHAARAPGELAETALAFEENAPLHAAVVSFLADPPEELRG
jgi:tRNA(adenine34) deaminase